MSKNNFISGITGLKGLAACIIAFAWHYQHFAGPEHHPFKSIIPYSYNLGWIMVEMFFILSGFGMMYGYSKKIREDRISFKDYFFGRLKKIYPLFIITTLLVVIFEFLYIGKTGTTFVFSNFDIRHFLSNLFMLHGGITETGWSLNAPSWCLTGILLCYIILYLILKYTKRKQLQLGIMAAPAALGIIMICTDLQIPVFNSLIGRGLSCFFIGAVLYELYCIKDKFPYWIPGAAALIFLIISYIAVRFMKVPFINFQLQFIFLYGPAMLLSIIFLPGVNAVLGIKPFVFLGKICMGIYLFHFPMQCLIATLDNYCSLNINYSSKLFWVLYVFITIGTAAVYNKLLAPRIKKMLTK